MNNKHLLGRRGFTLMELLVTIALLGILAVVSVSIYKGYIPKAQAVESYAMIGVQRHLVIQHVVSGRCTASGSDQTAIGQFGTAVISGTPNLKKGGTCPSGCRISYTFNNTGVDLSLAGTTVVADVLINGSVSKNDTLSTAPSKYLPREFAPVPVAVGDVCVFPH